tara:strand:+ start:43 stop:228 length:186 start_codon:yes stop_codon:yes gene_type:complete
MDIDKLILELEKKLTEDKDHAKRYEEHCKEEENYDYWCGNNGGVIYTLENVIKLIKEQNGQ